MPRREITKATNEVVAAAAQVISWWEFDCGWGKTCYESPPKRLRKAVLALAALKKRTMKKTKKRASRAST